MIISGFPGVGKTTLFNKAGELRILDSDSSNFSWSDKGVRNPNWPQNYIDHIKDQRDTADVILVSSHDVIRKALAESGIPFTLVYPLLEMKDEHIQRYKNRESDEQLVTLLEKNYEKWIPELMDQEGCKHVVLQSGEYLADVIEDLV